MSLHYLGNRLCRAARPVEFVAMMLLLHVCAITARFCQKTREVIRSCKENIHANRKIRRVNHRGAAALEAFKHLVLDIVPAGGAHHYSFEILCKETVVGPEGVWRSEIDANALLGQSLVCGTYVLTCSHTFYVSEPQDVLHHMTHLSISGYYYLHIN